MLSVPYLNDAITKLYRTHRVDDSIDRINYFVTSTLLAFFALSVSAKQYFGSPIQCFCPTEFKPGWEKYVEAYCSTHSSYYIAPDNEIPVDTAERDRRQFGYYHWVPVMLALQSLMFYLPNWVWITMHPRSGIDLNTLISEAENLCSMRGGERKLEMSRLSKHVIESLGIYETYKPPQRILCFRVGRKLSSYLTSLYLLVKLLYLGNLIAHFLLLNSFIGRGYALWGWKMMTSIWTGEDWDDPPVFPQISLCDFRVRQLANKHRYTVESVLTINMFNEKIFFFLWFWLLFVFVSTLLNIFYWVSSLVPPAARHKTICQLLKLSDKSVDTAPIIKQFANEALKPDGVLLLRLIEGHAGTLLCTELCDALYADYCRYRTNVYHNESEMEINGEQ